MSESSIQASSRSTHFVLKNIVLAVTSFLLSLIVAESLFRYLIYLREGRSLYEIQTEPPENYFETDNFSNLITISTDADRIYELHPNMKVRFLGARVTTDSNGFRFSTPHISNGNSQKTIVGIGDSLMFGWRVEEGSDYLSLLKRKLDKKYSANKWQVINTAVPGYNTPLEVATLKAKALSLNPEIVILGFVHSNDFELPYFVRTPTPYFSFCRIFLAEHIKYLSGITTPHTSLYHPVSQSAEVKAQGFLKFQSALDELSQLSHKHSFRVLVYIHEKTSLESLAEFQKRNFEIVYAWPKIQRKMSKMGITKYTGSNLTISSTDPHPSPLGHQIAARLLMKHLENVERLRG